jgi:hypothetical protein
MTTKSAGTRERRKAMFDRISAVPTRIGASLFTEASPVTRPTCSGPKAVAQVEEFLVHQGLDRAAVEAGLALAQGFVQECRGHQRLARSRGRGQHHVLAGQDLEQGFFLRGIERKPLARHVVEKAFEDVVAVERLGRRRERPRWR